MISIFTFKLKAENIFIYFELFKSTLKCKMTFLLYIRNNQLKKNSSRVLVASLLALLSNYFFVHVHIFHEIQVIYSFQMQFFSRNHSICKCFFPTSLKKRQKTSYLIYSNINTSIF